MKHFAIARCLRYKYTVCLLISWIGLWPVSTQALIIGSGGVALPFDAQLTSNQTTTLVLQVINDDASNDSILSWQLHLELIPVPSAQGNLTITNLIAPQDSLFDPGPMSLEELPSSEVHSFDADSS